MSKNDIVHLYFKCKTMYMFVQERFGELQSLAARSAKRTFKLKCDGYGLRKKVITLDIPTKWNSTYKLLHDVIAYRDVLADIYNESRMDGHPFITNDHWSLAMIIHDPNIHIGDIGVHENYTSSDKPLKPIPMLLSRMYLIGMKEKWHTHFNEFPHIYSVTAILNPGIKVERLANLFTIYYELLGIIYDVAYYVNKCKKVLERLCEFYGAVIQPELVGSSSKARILKDILAKPASTIASESSSSVGRRVLDDKRSCLAP
ncbi:Thiamine-phosphate synthase [Bienertia sinuspersici]